jgi:hypothetical protein
MSEPKNPHIGGSLDDFLKEEGMFAKTARARGLLKEKNGAWLS